MSVLLLIIKVSGGGISGPHHIALAREL